MTLQLEQEVQEIEVKCHLVTLDEYWRMIDMGVFHPEARIELIRGIFFDVPLHEHTHEVCAMRLHRHCYEQVDRGAIIWPQANSIALRDLLSQPRPDMTLPRRRDNFYRDRYPTAEDVILVREIAQSSLKYDQGEKLTLYAEAGIPEYWVVNIKSEVIEVYTEPAEGKYQSVRVAQCDETLQLPGGLEGTVAVKDVV